MKKRQKIYWKILRPLVIVFLYIKFGYTFKKAKNLPENFIVLANHNTDFDPIFVGVSFAKNLRYVASEHISRWKFAFKFVDELFSPILRPKGTNAASTVKMILRSLRAGENVCMFAEGSRSWNGVTAPILSSTGKLIKSGKCALVTYKITGGYFASPLWSEGGTRKGKVHGEIVNIYSAEQISQMSVDQINDIIDSDLFEDAYETQKTLMSKYHGSKRAEKIESMLFYCPKCKSMDSLKSKKHSVKCSSCGNSFTIDEYGYIDNLEQKTTKDLFSWLGDKVVEDANSNAVYCADNADLITVKNHIETKISSGKLSLDKVSLNCDDFVMNIEDIDDMSMHGRYALVLSTKDAYYEILVRDNVSALKFYMLFQVYKYGTINKFNF